MKQWQPTSELRFVARVIERWHPSHIEQLGTKNILQQQWQNLQTGAREWRDVPLVDETSPKEE